MNESYKIGTGITEWRSGEAQTVTFIVTEDCNLRCKYCYITHKASNKKMSYDVAKKFIDYILLSEEITKSKAIVLDFIGGEPLLEVRLIDRICDYFKIKAYEMNLEWSWNYRINICTNGVNFDSEIIQKFLLKNKDKLSLSITLDGTKEKHDLQRVFPNGDGSYDVIIKNIPTYVSMFSGDTKVTFASDDLKYLKDSIIHLWNLGIYEVASNVVFEDVWKPDDDLILEKQLTELADYVLDNELYKKYTCTFFDDTIGYPISESDLEHSFCGAGKMLALGPDGSLYPCMRYKDYSLNNKKEWALGNINDGIDMEKVRPFLLSSIKLQSDEECLSCPISSGCTGCQGFNYDDADSSTNFHKAKYICKMHKARVRANNYYFSQLYNRFNIEKNEGQGRKRELLILTSNNFTTFCQSSLKGENKEILKDEILIKALEFAHRNFYEPVIIHSIDEFNFEMKKEYNGYKMQHIIPYKFYNEAKAIKNVIWAVDIDETLKLNYIDNCILNVNSNDISKLASIINLIKFKVNRINLNIIDVDGKFPFDEYEYQLSLIKDIILAIKKENNNDLEINVLTDLQYINEFDHCGAGNKKITMSPNGSLYICPAFYANNPQETIGDIDEGITRLKDQRLYKKEYNPLCENCDSFHCTNCVFINKRYTREVNISPSFQCIKSSIEHKVSYQLMKEMYGNNNNVNIINHLDPLDEYLKDEGHLKGIYISQTKKNCEGDV